MTVSEIIEIEIGNTGSVILHKEGLFWKAYEHSAYLFHTRIRPLQLSSKRIKYLNRDIIYFGLPDNSLEKLLESNTQWNPERDTNKITINGFHIDQEEFGIWKYNNVTPINVPDRSEKSSDYVYASKIFEKIKKFPVLNKSPLDCQNFIIELQNTLNGTL